MKHVKSLSRSLPSSVEKFHPNISLSLFLFPPIHEHSTGLLLICVCVYVCVSKVPKTCEGQQTSENNRSLPDVVGTKKQISYRTEIIGGVPIVTQTQVKQNTV